MADSPLTGKTVKMHFGLDTQGGLHGIHPVGERLVLITMAVTAGGLRVGVVCQPSPPSVACIDCAITAWWGRRKYLRRTP